MKLATKVAVSVGATAGVVGMGALPASATTKSFSFSAEGDTCNWSVYYNQPTSSSAGRVSISIGSQCLRADADITYTYKGQTETDYIWTPAFPEDYWYSDLPAGAVITDIHTQSSIAAPGGPKHSSSRNVL